MRKCFQRNNEDVGEVVDMYESFSQHLEIAQTAHVNDWDDTPEPNCGGMTSKQKFLQVPYTTLFSLARSLYSADTS